MAPFKPFLSPRYPFSWNDELNCKFEESKSLIIEAICEGIEIFDVTKRTCLRPDWSAKGIGYYLSQNTALIHQISLVVVTVAGMLVWLDPVS